MIQDIEEESKTKFSMDVEFSFSFKVFSKTGNLLLNFLSSRGIVNQAEIELFLYF